MRKWQSRRQMHALCLSRNAEFQVAVHLLVIGPWHVCNQCRSHCQFWLACQMTLLSCPAGSMITEVTIGLGPAGELRYPAYPEGDGRWRFPGVGEFQCYDSYMLQHLALSAATAGHPEW